MTATWIVITATDLEDYVVAAQLAALRNAALGDSQEDPFVLVMPPVAARVRAEIQGCPRNKVSSVANSVPPALKGETCYLILERLQTRIPSLRLTDDQKELIKDARDYLKRISLCQVPIEQPDDIQETNVQKSGGVELASSTTRQATRTKLDGLT